MAETPDRLAPTARFSDRVADYVQYRPDYPAALLDWLQRECGVNKNWRVADVGAGTGISSKMFLDAGYRVTAVEPNGPMRAAAEHWLQGYEYFDAIDGRADATGLPDASVDLVTVAQAFHWFDEEATRREFARILRPGGLAAIWWNSRRLRGTRFLEGYEALLLNTAPTTPAWPSVMPTMRGCVAGLAPVFGEAHVSNTANGWILKRCAGA